MSLHKILRNLVPIVPNSILRNSHVCSSATFLTVSLTNFINKQVFWKGLSIFLISSISLFETNYVVVPNLRTFYEYSRLLLILLLLTTNVIKTFLTDGISTFFIYRKPVFGICSRTLSKIVLVLLFKIFEIFIILYQLGN